MAIPEMMIADLESVAKVLAEETVYCTLCGEPFCLWPPETLAAHQHAKHPETIWPLLAKNWQDFLAYTDPARREDYIQNLRVGCIVMALQSRADLFQKLEATGAIVKRPRGSG